MYDGLGDGSDAGSDYDDDLVFVSGGAGRQQVAVQQGQLFAQDRSRLLIQPQPPGCDEIERKRLVPERIVCLVRGQRVCLFVGPVFTRCSISMVWLAVVAAFLGLAGCSTVPETGRSQLNAYSSQEETQLGLTEFDKMKKEAVESEVGEIGRAHV